MHSAIRRRLFYSFLALFLILGPTVILYASGWRMDFHNLRIVKVGGIFLRNLPADALIKIDNKLIKNQGQKFFTGNLIGNLLPGNYNIEIEKDGYRGWQKIIKVEPAVVSETKPIVLMPQKEPETLLAMPLLNFWINESTLVYQEENGNYFLTDLNTLKSRTNLSILFNNLKARILNFPGYVPIADLLPQESPNRWIINTAKASYLIDVKKLTIEILPQKTNETQLTLTNGEEKILKEFTAKKSGEVKNITRYKDSAHLFIQYPAELYFLELDDRKPLNSWLIAKGIKKYVYNGNRLYLLKSSGLSYLEL